MYTNINTKYCVLIQQAAVALLCAVLLAACSDSSDSRPGDSSPEPELGYSAQIERTQYGTAHITADDWGSLGFGQGYATAQDRFCVIADQILKVRSKRAHYFGPGEENKHILSDFAYLALGVLDKAESILGKWPDDARDMAQGYAAGFNRFLEDAGVDNLPGQCAGQEWVQEIDVNSVVAYALDMSMLAGSRNFIAEIATAAPPDTEAVVTDSSTNEQLQVSGASNGVALGGDRTSNGSGLLLANPHWPWEGERLLHEVHLTIPGEIDVAGVTASGLLGVLIGFNDSVAWTHTTSTSNQFIVYTVDLVPENPTRYWFGDEERDMKAQTYTIDVKQADGTLVEESRTLYSSHYGPMLDMSAFGLPWTNSSATSIFDINADNVASTFQPIAGAESVEELAEVFSTVGGRPANNTIATDRHGDVFYADTTLVPNLSDEAEAAFNALVEDEGFNFTKLAFTLGLVILDGSDPLFSIEIDDRATEPGAIPFGEAPQLTGRRDFVANSNDSYWLSNPAEPLSGYSLRWGNIEEPQKMRTRMGLTQLSERATWGRMSLEGMLFENRSYTVQLWLEQFVSYCSQFKDAIASNGETIDISTACLLLSNWDGHYNLESIGAIVFRELLGQVDAYGRFGGTSYFVQPFDSLEPVATPSGLNEEGEAYLLGQLADAVQRLQKVGIPLEAPLKDYQYTLIGGQRIPLHGGQQRSDGLYNIAIYHANKTTNTTLLDQMQRPPVVNEGTDLTEGGYLVNYGASFAMVVEYTDEGPVADAILTYSQSDDPGSPSHNDQMSLFSSKSWRPLPFTREQIESDPALASMHVSASRE